VPHPGQNLAPGGCSAPQWEHGEARRAPQCTQNRASSGFC
jgi:hypothetical protein